MLCCDFPNYLFWFSAEHYRPTYTCYLSNDLPENPVDDAMTQTGRQHADIADALSDATDIESIEPPLERLKRLATYGNMVAVDTNMPIKR